MEGGREGEREGGDSLPQHPLGIDGLSIYSPIRRGRKEGRKEGRKGYFLSTHSHSLSNFRFQLQQPVPQIHQGRELGLALRAIGDLGGGNGGGVPSVPDDGRDGGGGCGGTGRGRRGDGDAGGAHSGGAGAAAAE